MSIRRWRGWPYVALGLLNAALFVPLFAAQGGRSDVLPFFPDAHPHGAYGFDLRSAAEYVKALLLRRSNLDVFRVSVELVSSTAVLLLFPARAWVRRALALFYTVLLVFLAYHHAYRRLYRVEPALWEDVDLLPSLVGYARESFGTWLPATAAVVMLLSVSLVFWAANATFAAVRAAADRRVLFVVLALLMCNAVSLFWFGIERNDPVFQVPSKAALKNYDASVARRERLLELQRAGADERYSFFRRAGLERKPRVFLLMIEAYGQRLVSDERLAPAFREIASRVEARLKTSGYAVRTAYSNAPVYGGKSWLSIATVQTGVRVEVPSIYNAMSPVAPRLATFTEFFRRQGYRTASLQPGSYLINQEDPYARDVSLEFKDLDYHGPLYGYVGVPDQFSLRTLKSRVLDVETRPLMTFFMSLSTHHYFPEIPFEGGPAWPPIEQASLAAEGLPRAYVLSVGYEWRCLLEVLESEAADDAVFFVVGDHQPLLERTMDDVQELSAQLSSNTPVHIISRNSAFVDRFEKYGFVPGIFAPPGTGGLRHEGLQSLFIHEFVGEYGGVGEQRFTRYFPEGIGLGGLVAPKSGDVSTGADGQRAADQQPR